ncbi:hypothetical protein AGMMS49543_24490 [Betaproteobacteria bacterium]|nr:hypothetical protein AGMMS49543_24490 [Betaproteobacteria bacterium]GHU20169.1 hypothetical protein AGMMS50243_14010 [Betaproteobacteria bacterium]
MIRQPVSSFARALIALVALSAGLISPPLQAAPFERHADNLAREVQAAHRDGKQLAVLFELSDCPSCHELKAEVLSKPGAGAFEQHFRTVSVTIDQQGELTTPRGDKQPRDQWATRLGVFATPALGFFDEKGQLVYRHLGTLHSAEELILLGRYIAEQGFEDAPWTDWRDAHLGEVKAEGHETHDKVRQPGVRPPGAHEHHEQHSQAQHAEHAHNANTNAVAAGLPSTIRSLP